MTEDNPNKDQFGNPLNRPFAPGKRQTKEEKLRMRPIEEKDQPTNRPKKKE